VELQASVPHRLLTCSVFQRPHKNPPNEPLTSQNYRGRGVKIDRPTRITGDILGTLRQSIMQNQFLFCYDTLRLLSPTQAYKKHSGSKGRES